MPTNSAPNSDLCRRCGHRRTALKLEAGWSLLEVGRAGNGHAKKGSKPTHPGFRTLSKQGIDESNSDFYRTSELAFCLEPLCSCIDFIEPFS